VKSQIPRLDNPLGKPPATTQGAPEDAPAAEKSERPKRTRTRKPKGDAVVQETPVEAPKPVEAAPVPEQQPKQEQPRRNDHQRDQKPRDDKPHDDKPRRERGGRGRNNNNHHRGEKNTIVGLGDDTPAFIALSFEDRDKG